MPNDSRKIDKFGVYWFCQYHRGGLIESQGFGDSFACSAWEQAAGRSASLNGLAGFQEGEAPSEPDGAAARPAARPVARPRRIVQTRSGIPGRDTEHRDAKRRRRHSHAERGNEVTPGSPDGAGSYKKVARKHYLIVGGGSVRRSAQYGFAASVAALPIFLASPHRTACMQRPK
jgi:hypothetical protein